jgi:mannose-1-phosphate guanylyltransferase/mannose-6-phosphate isomerase
MATTADYKITPVILAGGPQGRGRLLNHRGGSHQSLLLQAMACVADESLFTSPVIVANADDEDVLRVELDIAGIEPAAAILAKTWPGDATALVMSAMLGASLGYQGAMLVLPLDRLLPDAETLAAWTAQARSALQLGAYVSFGLEPGAAPEQAKFFVTGSPISMGVDSEEETPRLFTVADFATSEEAKLLASDNGAFADTGIHLLPIVELLKDLRLSGPRIYSNCQVALSNSTIDQYFVRPKELAADKVQSSTIIETLLSRSSRNIVVAVSDFAPAEPVAEEWHFVPEDASQNITSGDIILQDVSGAYVHSCGPVTAVAGLDNVVVVNLGAAVIVTSRSHMQHIRPMAEAIRQQLHVKAARAARMEMAQDIAHAVDTAAPEPEAFVLQRAAG